MSFRNITTDQGTFYVITTSGELLWYKDLKQDGTNGPNAETGWDARSGSQIGVGWQIFSQVFSGGDGIIYGIKPTGELLWYKDLKRDGTNGPNAETGWDARSGSQFGTGWAAFTRVCSGVGGIIYAITVDGFLLYYRDQARNGTANWAYNGIAQTIGSGWFMLPNQTTTLEGYCVPISAGPGETIEFKISARSGYDVTYLRLKAQDNGEIGISLMETFSMEAGQQDIPLEAWQDGCDWETAFTLDVPEDWQSGLYAAKCTASDDSEIYVIFVVKPGQNQRADFAILANTNTWNAYNGWGGKSKYSTPPGTILSFERPNPATSPVDDGHVNHLTRAELWVLGWLEDAGYKVDVYADQDFHAGIDDFEGYKGLILSTHPEYWTLEMLNNLEAYLAAGGNLLYLGGNGLFEQCVYNDSGTALTFWGGDPSLGRDRNYFRNLNPPRSERAILGVAFVYNNYLTVSPPAPYKVEMADHPFLEGTGLANGDFVGQTGLNGAASGWEIDISDNGNAPDGAVVTAWANNDHDNDRGNAPDNIQVIARGANQPVEGPYTAHMTYYKAASDGFVFSVGSLCFGGSLVQDANLQAIVKNVLNECLSR